MSNYAAIQDEENLGLAQGYERYSLSFSLYYNRLIVVVCYEAINIRFQIQIFVIPYIIPLTCHIDVSIKWLHNLQTVDINMSSMDNFSLNRLGNESITLWYNLLQLITLMFVFHTLSIGSSPYTNTSHNHNMRTQLQHLLVKFLNTDTQLHAYYIKTIHVWSHWSYLISEDNNKIYV